MIKKIKCVIFSPLAKCFSIIFLVYLILAAFLYLRPGRFHATLEKLEIEERIRGILKVCPDSYVTWASFDQRIFSDKYIFEDVIGKDLIECQDRNGRECKIASVRKYNPWYLEPHNIDLDSYYFLDSFRTNEIRYFPDLSKLKSLGAINETLSKTFLKITEAHMAVIKGSIMENGIKKKVLYLFILTNHDKAKLPCKPETAKREMKDLLTHAEDIL